MEILNLFEEENYYTCKDNHINIYIYIYTIIFTIRRTIICRNETIMSENMDMVTSPNSDVNMEDGGDGDNGAPARTDVPLNIQMISGVTFAMTSNYKLIRPIGKGAYGLVVSAEVSNDNNNNNNNEDNKVAVKKVAHVLRDLVDAKRLLRELKIGQHLAAHETKGNNIPVADI